MRTSSVMLALLCTMMLSGGQVLFKLAAAQLKATDKVPAIVGSVVTNPYFLVGVLIYGAATVLWIWVLRDTPLSIAYPITALAFVIVPFLGVMLFGEPYHPRLLWGAIMIVAGVYFIAR